MFIDFDGTLAPIVADPPAARPLPGTSELLARLATRFSRVAVISGRPASFLADHLAGAGGTELVGLYGMERTRGAGSGVEASPAAEVWRSVVAKVADTAERAAPAGLWVERKGLTVTLHYRRAPALAGWAADFAAEQAAATGLAAHPGKMSVELVPPLGTDKGAVVEELGAGLRAVCFLGDDKGDLPAFAALTRMRSSGRVTLAVAVRGAGGETPAELERAADVVVEGPEGARGVLEALAGR